jgi:hypothetical protein
MFCFGIEKDYIEVRLSIFLLICNTCIQTKQMNGGSSLSEICPNVARWYKENNFSFLGKFLGLWFPIQKFRRLNEIIAKVLQFIYPYQLIHHDVSRQKGHTLWSPNRLDHVTYLKQKWQIHLLRVNWNICHLLIPLL